MILLFDFGNTRSKCAIYKQNQLVKYYSFQNFEDFLSLQLLSKWEISQVFICAVTNNYEPYAQFLQKNHITTQLFLPTTPIPLANHYNSIATLGSDRLAASIGSFASFPNQNVLTIDAGTCLKYNFVNDKNQYLGGAISPGIKLRYQTLNQFTARLPLLQFDDSYNKLIGASTQESINTGVQQGAIGEMLYFITQYKNQYPDFKVVITGGDANYFVKHIKMNIFVRPYLIFDGLNFLAQSLH